MRMRLLSVVGAAAATAAACAIWLRADHPSTAQLIALCAALLVVVIAATSVLAWWSVAITVTVVVLAAWLLQTAPNDESGLFVVGAIILIIGVGAASCAVAALCSWAWSARRHALR
ncbi:hypothetical protein GIS00_06560 [Nakamurella sp. YIM 132087]|uniref:Uncharacterized protein n=1 Tax=Nakamurella alba TaxID=2665158 RepID=A0A7K1FL49_9ACTN|nr:hypothetical protein [Nakamurella alba]MTD13604.1 hypothetical protein [Nakamurella alba]